VRRRAPDGSETVVDVPLDTLVPGDIVELAAGNMIPGDIRLLEAKDLFINQSALTGESMPIEKFAAPFAGTAASPFDLPNMCFMGENVVSGYARGLIVRTGRMTFSVHWPIRPFAAGRLPHLTWA